MITVLYTGAASHNPSGVRGVQHPRLEGTALVQRYGSRPRQRHECRRALAAFRAACSTTYPLRGKEVIL